MLLGRRRLRLLLGWLAALPAAGSGLGASDSPFTLAPDPPVAGSLFSVTAAYGPACFVEGWRLERIDGELRLTVFEPCTCPFPVPPPVIETFTQLVAPLAAGAHSATLFVERREDGLPCGEPVEVGRREFDVAPSLYEVRLSPLFAGDRDPVTLTVRHPCPYAWADPVVDGGLIHLVQGFEPAGTAASCASTPAHSTEFALGRLAAGPYRVLLYLGAESFHSLRHADAFEVHPGFAEDLLLAGGRLRLTAQWRRPGQGSGAGLGRTLTPDSGAFWFFRPTNLELLVKVLPACDVNGHFWVLAGGLTDVEVELQVEDLASGRARTYLNPQGQAFRPVLDTQALPCD
jgi:hypothetical protein